MPSPLASQLTQRFFRYLSITSQSDANATTLPTTPGQFDMARELANELKSLGLEEIVIDDRATVTAVKKKATLTARRASVLSPISIPLMLVCRRIFIRKSCVLRVKISA